jgi:putative hydrolase of the HAD superfamily
METKALIFDLGGVIFNYSFDNTFKIWSDEIGISPEILKSKFRFTKDFEKFERNEISPGQYYQTITAQLSSRLTEKTFEKGWNSIYQDIIPNIDKLLQQIKPNYRLVALTNTNITHAKI